MNTRILAPEEIPAAAEILRRGGLLGLPTETVYGLGANGLDPAAVAAIFAAKGRPQDNPLILHIPGPEWLERYCTQIPPQAYRLAERFWPGPLTLILKRRPCVPDAVTAGLDTVGMRCPDHPVARAILTAAGVPVAAPSGNTSGRPSPTCAAHMLEDMQGKIDAIVDGGPCTVGVESTIVDLTLTPPRLLRPGGVSLEQLEEVLGEVAVDPAVRRRMADGERPRAPGMKYRHYAPQAPVTVVRGEPAATAAYIREQAEQGAGVICFAEYAGTYPGRRVRSLGPAADKAEQARRVFDALRSFDGTPVERIWAQCPDEGELGLAVCNRLNKAAGFHIVEAPGKAAQIIGITGPTGAGKTTALKALEELGAVVIDADAVYHRLLAESAPLQAALIGRFGGGILDADGKLDRKRLGAVVFADPAALTDLNRITHGFITAEVDRLCAQAAAQGRPAAVDAIALIESGLGARCGAVVGVLAPKELRIRRIMEREGIPYPYARSRVEAQPEDAFFRAHCDYILENGESRTQEEFRAEALALFRRILDR